MWKLTKTKLSAQEIIERLGLEPLEKEGGMVVRSYTSRERIAERPAGTACYYLLSGGAYSHLHRLSGDEVYHFYLGDPVELTELLPDGSFRITVLGGDLLSGQKVQHAVPSGIWQGARLLPGGALALLGTTMCPGYDPNCYEHGERARLIRDYPDAAAWIERLTGEARFS